MKSKSCEKRVHLVTDDGLYDRKDFYKVKNVFYLSSKSVIPCTIKKKSKKEKNICITYISTKNVKDCTLHNQVVNVKHCTLHNQEVNFLLGPTGKFENFLSHDT